MLKYGGINKQQRKV